MINCIKDLNMKVKAIKLLGKNISVNLYDLGLDSFLDKKLYKQVKKNR